MMIYKFTFNETIKRVFNCITNSQIICHNLLKDYISDVKIVNDIKKRETNNSKSIIRNINDSSQNLYNINNLASKTNNSIHPMLAVNNSFLFLNSSLSVNLEKLEGLIFECRWKKKYILSLKIVKVQDSERFFKSMDIECLEMNHYEKAFNLQIRLYWNSYELKTHLLFRFLPKDQIIEEIIQREFSKEDKKILFNKISEYLNNDLSNLENCLTSLVFASMKELSLYLRDIRNIISHAYGMENKKFEFYQSPLINSVKNCRLYDSNNNLWQEYTFTGYFVDKNRACKMRWEKKENNKQFCIYRISICYLEENISLLIFKNVFQTHVTTQYLSDINIRKKSFLNELRNYFNKKHAKFGYQNIEPKISDLHLMIAIKAIKDDNEEDNNDLNLFINNNVNMIKNDIEKEEQTQTDKNNNLQQTISFIDNENKDYDNLFGDSIQNISEIKNNNSTFLFGVDDINGKN